MDYYSQLDAILSSEPVTITNLRNNTDLKIKCNSSQYYKLDASTVKDVYINTDCFCVVNITAKNKKIEVDGPAQVYITGDNNTIYNDFNIGEPFSHHLIIINGRKNELKVNLKGTSSAPYNVATAIVNDPEFITLNQSVTNFSFLTTYNSSFICNIGPFNQVNISKLYSSYGFYEPIIYYYPDISVGYGAPLDKEGKIILGVVIGGPFLIAIISGFILCCCECCKGCSCSYCNKKDNVERDLPDL
ncbi:hypothetical protein TVAG_217710 [Trichomonas vaginalis G3]|uniref:Uncharacterized protein n=1 Tax=Trichomonas vaginalis (strain ATCC PRA-98 / G3) TaxID=412133 RepID=A2F0L8_TRIV3|nr:hypothetical protein TVAGG3_0928930 [Trichomonas vaginalis G3]EAY01533.1 hypothetical protein TVAG_217710 [Trichomonas vaginalis G3]KAI5485687.1 hypothetical protein TVAGG3_0928930 [Trichomonas vaginalis G3]|eukprot:XP_001330304.1 hypothetical protein [Trichomonas vaginalis G3]